MVRLGILSLVVALVAACGPGPTGTPVDACPLSVTTGTLEARAGQMWIVGGSAALPIRWRTGWSLDAQDGTLVVLGPDGVVVARDGDRVELPGGAIGDSWLACGFPYPVRVLAPASDRSIGPAASAAG